MRADLVFARLLIAETEAPDNLSWFAEDYFSGKRLIIWKGAGGLTVRRRLLGGHDP